MFNEGREQASFGSTDANAIPADQTKTASDVLRANPNSFAQVTRKLHSSEMANNPIRPKSVERSVPPGCCVDMLYSHTGRENY